MWAVCAFTCVFVHVYFDEYMCVWFMCMYIDAHVCSGCILWCTCSSVLCTSMHMDLVCMCTLMHMHMVCVFMCTSMHIYEVCVYSVCVLWCAWCGVCALWCTWMWYVYVLRCTCMWCVCVYFDEHDVVCGWVCVLRCTWCGVWVCVCTLMHMMWCVCMEARGWAQVTFLYCFLS